MQHNRITARLDSVWRDAVARAASLGMTIRGRILIAFLIMSVITGGLGIYATFGIRHAGILVDKTFDESLMSINYARAAAADFAGMRAAFMRQWIATDPSMRAELGKQISKLSALRSPKTCKSRPTGRSRSARPVPPKTCAMRSRPGRAYRSD
jgi:hypothetical protein